MPQNVVTAHALLDAATQTTSSSMTQEAVSMAQVHATLAVAAAIDRLNETIANHNAEH